MAKAIYLLVLSLFVIVGCSMKETAGPFITSISHEGEGRLSIEECMLQFGPWAGTLTTTDCSRTSILINKN